MSIASDASIDNHTLPPCSTSPIQIVNDLDKGDELTYPTSYRHLKVEAHYPAYSVN
ncbi:hypothetical protein EWM64_g7860 [Hericium alpestre]|uniref:Uncharacterized protein n=1 Tax=Hericium alpestre TaxID=135208 RepID=A0A4Y9ZQP2_9AGAM|nr:hypothetical protein EWM64_g7860 [Hericium alpestre]